MSERPEAIAVTGASRGIGRAIAERLLSQGRRVLLVARDAARLEEVAALAPDRAEVLAADLIAEPDALARRLAAEPWLDGLVHAAGIAPHAPLEAIDARDFERAWRLHVLSPFESARALGLSLRTRGAKGSMVLVSSTLGLRPAPTMLVYSATKAALLNMTRTLALELAPDGVRVNAVAPGVVDTDMARELRLPLGTPPPTDEAERAQLVETQLEELTTLHPIGRLGAADDVADAVLHLLDAPWTTGSVLTVDGGLLAG